MVVCRYPGARRRGDLADYPKKLVMRRVPGMMYGLGAVLFGSEGAPVLQLFENRNRTEFAAQFHESVHLAKIVRLVSHGQCEALNRAVAKQAGDEAQIL